MAKDVAIKVYVEKLSKLVHNDANPRLIKSKAHKELIKSLKAFPEMLLLREIVVDENLLILAGDKRVYALVELGYVEITVKQVIGMPEAKKREFIAKDNIHNGEWDTNVIANEWDLEELKDWGAPDFTKTREPKEKQDYQNHEITCPNCGESFALSESASD